MTSIEELRQYVGDYDLVPVVREIPAGDRTPAQLARTLRGQSKRVFLLENTTDGPQGLTWDRYAYLGYEPAMELSCTDGVMKLQNGSITTEVPCEDPTAFIKGILHKNRAPRIEGMPPFTGGLVGYLAYEYIKYTEPTIKWDNSNPEGFRDVSFLLFDKVYVYDREAEKILLIVNIRTDALEDNYARAAIDLEKMEHALLADSASAVPAFHIKSDFQPMFDLDKYIGMVEGARSYIQKGETCQIVLSQAVSAEAEGCLLDAYDVLLQKDPTRYMFYLSNDDAEAAVASPESIVKLCDGQLLTAPLAGTFRRGKDPEEDKALEQALLSDDKSIVEHNMLVDDARNEFGAFCKIGSIKVVGYLNVIKCAKVMHLGSVVTGELAEGKTAMDVIASMTPGGVVSGSPKIHGCELINGLEGNRRGIYGSSLGWISLNGDADFCEFIHSAFTKNGKVYVRSGGGIVMDSVPEDEHEECLNKALAMTDALYKADKGGAAK